MLEFLLVIYRLLNYMNIVKFYVYVYVIGNYRINIKQKQINFF